LIGTNKYKIFLCKDTFFMCQIKKHKPKIQVQILKFKRDEKLDFNKKNSVIILITEFCLITDKNDYFFLLSSLM
jgi:hypothetical protein